MLNLATVETRIVSVVLDASACWMEKGRPVCFRVRRLRRTPDTDGYVCVQIVFLMFCCHIGIFIDRLP